MDALALGTLTVLDDEIAEFTAELILGPRDEMTEFTMFPWLEPKLDPALRVDAKLFCPKEDAPEPKLDPDLPVDANLFWFWLEPKLDPALRVDAKLFCPREEVLDAEPTEDEDMADWTAEPIWG